MTQLKKQATIKRDPISGHHQHVDITDNREVSPNELLARAQSRLDALKQAISDDSTKADGKIPHEEFHPALGDSMNRQPRPHDVIDSPESDVRYGMAVRPDHSPTKVNRHGNEHGRQKGQ